MAVNGVNGNQEIKAYEKPEDINLKPADVYDSKKIGNVLAGIELSVNRDIESALANDGVVDDTEKGLINRWRTQLDSLSKSVANIVSDTYTNFGKRIDVLKDKISQSVGPESLEPDDTDAGIKAKSTKVEVAAEELRIPDKKFQSVSDNKKECEQIKNEYVKILDNKYQSNRKIAADLKCFQAKYEDQLKTVAPSIHDDGKYEVSNLFDQVGSQIRYYDKLADKERQEAQQQAQSQSSLDKVQVHWAGVKQAKGPLYGTGSRISLDMQVVNPESEFNKEID